MRVSAITSRIARQCAVENHYLHRAPPVSFCFGLHDGGELVGVVTFGVPPSRHALVSACRESPESVIELNRLWVHDRMPRNTESWFVSRALEMMPPRIVISYADTAHGHAGYIYRALNFYYAGWTDMDRKTPRFDYVVPGKHSRQAFRNGTPQFSDRVRRKPKVKYWTVTGNRRDRKRLAAACGWPCMSWKETPPPVQTKTPA